MFIGLRIRTTLLVILLVAAGGSGYGAFALARERAHFQDQLRGNLEATLAAFAIPCGMAIAADRIDTLDRLVAEVSARGEVLGLMEITVLDHTGRVMADSRVERFGQTLTDGFTAAAMHEARPLWQSDGGRAFLSHPITSGLRWGTLRATISLAPLEAQVAKRRRELIVVVAGTAALIATALVLLLSVLVVDPVRRLAAVARELGRGQREARVETYRRDELGELGRTFDEMAAQIDRHTVELELTVDKRTRQLAESNQRLKMSNELLASANRQLERLAITDGLTGLFNHRHFQERLTHEVKRGERASHSMAVLMIDVDHFKLYNDAQGHPAGDELLRDLSVLLANNLRETDVVARYGGEEFVVLLVDTDRTAGLATAEKLRELVEAYPFPHQEKQPGGKLTISLGIAFYPDDGRSPGDLIWAADQALYKSKRAGRNRVTATGEES